MDDGVRGARRAQRAVARVRALSSRADTEFQYNREELFARIRVPVERRLEDFHPEQEAQRIVDSVREAMTARSA